MRTYVKIRRDGENFWLRIITEDKSGGRGTVDNQLVLPHAFKYGDVITFTADEVADYIENPADIHLPCNFAFGF